MIDTRIVGQELQDQVLSAARKGRQRVTSTVKTVTATAQHIRPQLASLPRPNLTKAALPTPAELRDKAPALVAKLPTAQQLMSGAQELAGHARSVQRFVFGQVRTIAAPLAQQAAARLSKVGAQPAQPETTTRVREVKVAGETTAKDAGAAAKAAPRAAASQQKAKPGAKAAAK